MYFSVDRIIGGTAELMGEDKRPLSVPVGLLPPGAREGDMLFYGREGFAPAPDKTAERRSRVADMLERLLHMPEEDGPGGGPNGADGPDEPGALDGPDALESNKKEDG